MASYIVAKSLWRAAKVGGVVMGLGVGSWFLLRSGRPAWLFSPALRVVVAVQRPFTGCSVTFDSVTGSLADGVLDFRNLHVVWRRGRAGQRAECDLTFERVAVNVGELVAEMILRDTEFFKASLDSLDDSRTVVIPKVAVKGVRGELTLLIRKPETPPPNLVIEDLVVSDVDVVVSDEHRRVEKLVFPKIEVDSLQVSPYALRKPVIAALFNTEGSGSVGGAPFRFDRGRLVSAQLPVEFVSRFLAPPLSWVKTGNARFRATVEPVPGKRTFAVSTTLSLRGSAEPGDTAVFGAATNQISAFLDSREISVTAREEVSANPKDEEEFLREVNKKFAALILTKVGSAAAGAVASIKKSGWF